MKEFRNKVVVITGAGSGMGRAYALAFARLGARLALNDYDASALAQTVELCEAQGMCTTYTSVFDVSDRSAMQAFAAGVAETLGHAHVVINNAGIEGGTLPVLEMGESDYRRVIDVNFFGVLHGTQAFLPHLVANGQGALLNVSSVFGLVGMPFNSDYCAAKFAVTGFTEALMAEFQESPITIHCVHPGGIATNIARSDAAGEFSAKFLTTDPDDFVRYVIDCIKRREPKVVYGNRAWTLWAASNFVPTRLLKAVVWQQMRSVLDLGDYLTTIKAGRVPARKQDDPPAKGAQA